jgi:acetylornithine deacetylase
MSIHDHDGGGLSRRELLALLPAVALAGRSARASTEAGSDEALRVLDAVDDAADLALLRRMIALRSYSGSGEEGAVSELMAERMRALGLQVELQEVEPGRHNALGVLPGAGGGGSLMLEGHLDTNPVGVGWTVDPFAGLVRDGFVWGIGVSNMKASCAAFFGAARALVGSGTRLRGDLRLAYVVGELQGGIGALRMLKEGVRADAFVVGEPTDLAVLTLHATDLNLQINTLGVTRHLSKMEESVSAIDTMYRVIERLKAMEFTGPDDPESRSVRRLNVGSMRAGLGREVHDWRPGQVPDFASIRVSIRFGPGQTAESVLADVRRGMEALHESDPRVVTEVVPLNADGRIPLHPFRVSRDERIVKAVVAAHERVVGAAPAVGAVAPYRYYGSDASHLQYVGGMKGVVCGAGGKYNTMPDERVELTQFHAATRIFALTALAMCS